VRERLDVRSAATLALGDKGVTADVNALADTLMASEAADTARVKLAAKASAARLKTAFTDAPVLTAAEQAAAKLIPSRVENPPGAQGGRGAGAGAGGGAPATAAPAGPTLTGYYTQEARNFADGQRSVLDIRNAIAAEFGPVPVETVVNFFRNGERQGQYTIVVK